MRARSALVTLFALLFVLLIVSISLNFYLFDAARLYYSQLNGLRLDPLGLDSFSGTPQTELQSDTVRVVFFGDSRAANWNAPDIDGFEFLNRGIRSQTSVQTIERYDEHLRPLSFDILVLQVCINDLKTIPLFPTRKDGIIANCETNIQQITTSAVEQGATVILTTVFPAGPVPLEREIFWSAEIPDAIIEVNTFINSLGGDRVIIFDAYTILADENGEIQEAYRFDELHLNSAGYEALNKELIQLLASLKSS
jgi:lysophospholipase L1-like esterase